MSECTLAGPEELLVAAAERRHWDRSPVAPEPQVAVVVVAAAGRRHWDRSPVVLELQMAAVAAAVECTH